VLLISNKENYELPWNAASKKESKLINGIQKEKSEKT